MQMSMSRLFVALDWPRRLWRVLHDGTPFITLLRHLDVLFPQDAVLLVETDGAGLPEPVEQFVDRACKGGGAQLSAEGFSLALDADNLFHLTSVMEECGIDGLGISFYVYRGRRFLLTGHDAANDDNTPFSVSGEVPEGSLREFCDLAACRYALDTQSQWDEADAPSASHDHYAVYELSSPPVPSRWLQMTKPCSMECHSLLLSGGWVRDGLLSWRRGIHSWPLSDFFDGFVRALLGSDARVYLFIYVPRVLPGEFPQGMDVIDDGCSVLIRASIAQLVGVRWHDWVSGRIPHTFLAFAGEPTLLEKSLNALDASAELGEQVSCHWWDPLTKDGSSFLGQFTGGWLCSVDRYESYDEVIMASETLLSDAGGILSRLADELDIRLYQNIGPADTDPTDGATAGDEEGALRGRPPRGWRACR